MALDVLYFLPVSLAVNVVLFVAVQRSRKDVLIDLSYALNCIVLTLYGLVAFGVTAIKGWAALMVYLWATRLAVFLFIRIRRRGRDERFDGIRGNIRTFGMFWIGQAVATWIVLLPASLLFLEEFPPFTKFSLVGIVVWACGLAIETVADIQKYRFITNPRNQGAWIEEGLWGYSRHPNYFGEIVVWIGVYLYAFPALTGTEAVIALVSPVLVFLLIRFVAGVPLLEKIADQRWGKVAAYREYKKRTNLLIPLPPKH